MDINNFKAYGNKNKLKKMVIRRVLPIAASVVAVGSAFIGLNIKHKNEIKNLQGQILLLQQTSEDNNANYQKQIDDIAKEKDELAKKYQELEERYHSLALPKDIPDNSIDRDTAISIFYKDGTLSVDSISEPFYVYYIYAKDVAPDAPKYTAKSQYVVQIEVDGVSYLVDANDYTNVIFKDYKAMTKTAGLLKYYSSVYGGSDSKGAGNVVCICDTNDKLYIVDFDDFKNVLLRGIDTIDMDAKYVSAYDPANGGHDTENRGAGYAYEVIKDGIKYLVDANNFSLILAYDYESWNSFVDEAGVAKLAVTYKDGHQDIILAEALVPNESDVLIR